MTTLKRKTIRSSILVFGNSLFQRTTNFISKIVLAWLLVPSDFGLMAIASIVINIVAFFRDGGLDSALIYKKDEDGRAADTAFIIIWALNIGLYIVAFLLAPFAAGFFGEPMITTIVQVSSLTFILYAISFVPTTLLEKELVFKNYVLLSIATTTLGLAATIYMAFIGYGVWSLVYGGLIGGLTSAVGVWFLTPWRPKLRFDRKLASEMVHYGKFMVGVTLVIFLIQNVDNAVVGKTIDMTMLGIYAMAYSFCNLPASTVMQTINQVLFPAYSKLQGDREKLRATYIKVFNLVSLLVFPISLGIFITAPAFITIVLKEKWLAAILPLQILAFFGLFRSLAGTTGEMFKALGNPKIIFTSYSVQLLIMGILLYPATLWYGITGTSVVVVLASFPTMVWLLTRVCRGLQIEYSTLIRISGTHLIASVIMALVAYVTGIALGMNIISLCASILVGVISYSLGVYLMTGGRVISDVMEVVRAVKQN